MGYLRLSRRVHEKILIGDDIVLAFDGMEGRKAIMNFFTTYGDMGKNFIFRLKEDQSVFLDIIEIKFFYFEGGQAKIGINAPKNIRIIREEISLKYPDPLK